MIRLGSFVMSMDDLGSSAMSMDDPGRSGGSNPARRRRLAAAASWSAVIHSDKYV
jgi:hypothetical protein